VKDPLSAHGAPEVAKQLGVRHNLKVYHRARVSVY
jgi:hypothetical protein